MPVFAPEDEVKLCLKSCGHIIQCAVRFTIFTTIVLWEIISKPKIEGLEQEVKKCAIFVDQGER